MLEGSDDNIGRNNSLLVRYGYTKFYDSLTPNDHYIILINGMIKLLQVMMQVLV
jgi:hypothetical protein